MPWITLTPADVAGTLLAPEAAALSAHLLAPGAADPVPAALSDTIAEVHGYIAARSGCAVGELGTLPSELKASALAIARWRLLTRLAAGRSAQVLLTEPRRKDYEDAIGRLKDVAAGRFFVAPPEMPAVEQPRPVAAGAFGSSGSAFNL